MKQIATQSVSAAAALIKINGLNLLVPQGEIRTLESVKDVNTTDTSQHSVGRVAYAQTSWPVYCLSEDLLLMTEIPAERRACALIPIGVGYMGLLCDDMMVLKSFVAKQYALPIVMKLPDTPILHLVEYEQGIACVSNSYLLTAYIEQMIFNK